MTIQTERMTTFSAAGKKPWKAPVLEALALHGALGASPGSKCDKYGSLSVGTGCPK
jgi:hypothetical protein